MLGLQGVLASAGTHEHSNVRSLDLFVLSEVKLSMSGRIEKEIYSAKSKRYIGLSTLDKDVT